MGNQGISRVFGWVALIVAVFSFYFAVTSHPDPALYVTLMTWGALFLVIGVVLLSVNRMP